MRLFLNPGNSAHLRGLADDFGESTNAVRLELNRFEEAGMLLSETQGNKKLYKANSRHPLFFDINKILLKYVGIDHVLETIIGRLGELQQVYLSGDYAAGKDSGLLDLIFVGEVDSQYLLILTEKAEKLIKKKIRYLLYTPDEWANTNNSPANCLLLWEKVAVGN